MTERIRGRGAYQVMPPLTDEEYQALKEDIAENGVLIPVVEDAAGNVLDGHHRIQAWQELLDEGRVVDSYPTISRSDLKTDAEKRDLAWKLNMQRRHLSQEQKRGAIAAKLKESHDWADNRIAQLLGVDGKTVRSVRTSLEIRKEIPKAEMLLGNDGKYYPRNRTGDLEAELAMTKTDAVRQELHSRLGWPHLDEERKQAEVQKIDAKWSVSEEHVEDQRKEMEEQGPRLKDFGEEQMGEIFAHATEYAYGNVDQRVARLVRDKMRDLADLVTSYGGKKKHKAKPEEVAESVVEYYMSNHNASVRRFAEDEESMVRTDVERYRLACAWILEFVPLLEEKLEKRITIEREVSELRHDLQEDEGVNPPPA